MTAFSLEGYDTPDILVPHFGKLAKTNATVLLKKPHLVCISTSKHDRHLWWHTGSGNALGKNIDKNNFKIKIKLEQEHSESSDFGHIYALPPNTCIPIHLT